MSEPLQKAIGKVSEEAWEPYGKPHPVEMRECAEVSFVPGEKSEHKDTQPLRYIAIRTRQRQENRLDRLRTGKGPPVRAIATPRRPNRRYSSAAALPSQRRAGASASLSTDWGLS